MREFIQSNRERIAELCRENSVRRLSVFGSALRDDFDPVHSDVDLLVEFEELNYPHSVERYWKLEQELSSLFARPVDLVRESSVVNPYLRRAIDAEKESLYAA